ncbi:glycosyltransferase family 2 protein [Candidatus Saccharibacteria bacterium]|nr:MAG: glycosyltransferase family 2 protein [Candidatus Saccharibacteria bacterium]
MRTSIIVANHGRDLTKLIESLPTSVEFIEINRGFERSKQRNMGIQEASGEIIIWLDSDQSLSIGLVEECEELIKNGAVAVYIPEIIVARSFFGRIRAFERTFYTGTAIDVPRAVLKASCPLFDETLNGPEDACFGQRIIGKRAVSKLPLFHHDDIPFLEYCKKKAYYTKSMKRYAEKYQNDPCLNLKYRCFDVFVQDGKWKKLVKHPILTLGIVFLLAVRAFIYYKNK